MNPLQTRLALLRLRLRLFVGWRGICAVAAIVLGAGVLVGLADWIVQLPSLIRAFSLFAILGTSGFVFYRYLFVPITERCDDLSLALRIEARYPELNDALASTVQFMERSDEAPAVDSAAMRKRAIEKALEQANHVDFGGILNRRGGFWITLGALAAVAAAGYFLWNQPTFSGIAFWRLADPFGNHTWTRIDMADCPHIVAQGRPYPLRAHIDGVVPKAGALVIDDFTPMRKDKPLEIKLDSTGNGVLVSGIDMTQRLGKFRFRIVAGDGAFPPGNNAWHNVEVLAPPSFVKLNGHDTPQIELRPPAYTEWPPVIHLAPGNKYIHAIAGTHVTFRAAVDRPIEAAWIEFRPENPIVTMASRLAPMGFGEPMAAAAALALGSTVWNPVNARFTDEAHRVFVMDFVPPVTGAYHFEMRENQFLAKDYYAELRIVQDPPPVVQLHRPSSSMDVVADANIYFQMSIEDEMFPGNAAGAGAVRSAYLEYRRKNAEGQWLDGQPTRVPLYDHKAVGSLMPRLSMILARSLWVAPDVRLRPPKLDIAYHWPLKNRFKDGEIVSVQACADDFCDIEPGRLPGRSAAIELRIVTREDIAKTLDKGLGDTQKELVRLQQMQEAALKLTKEVRNKKPQEIEQKDIDKLIEAEQTQRVMQERIGQTPEEGLRAELAKLQQMIKENKLPGSTAQDRIKTVKTELDRLATQELPQIEPDLAEARKELAQPPKQEKDTKGGKDKPDPKKDKDKNPLDKVERHQQEVKTALDKLNEFLDPWASMNEIKGKTNELLKDQKALADETAKLDAAMKNADADPNVDAKVDPKKQDAIKEENKMALLKLGDKQKDLAERADQVVEQAEKAGEKRAQEGDKETADKLKNAAKIGRDGMLSKNMREVAEKLNNKDVPHMQDALGKQAKNIKQLEQMAKALENKKEDDLERLTAKRKKAGEKHDAINELVEKQEKLQKKTKEAAKIADPKEREKELKRLADEQEKLKEEAQKNARELARLAEDQASQDLDRAAQEMEKAAQKMQEGANPEENQNEALDRLQNAQDQIQAFEDELAREQLAKIADRIKGLVERQEAAGERSKELQKKVLARKNWGNGAVSSLDGDRQAQEGLATETRSLKEKLKDAKVFEHIFEKAAQAMDQAAAAMKERKEVAVERQVGAMDAEELADENRRGEEILQRQALAGQRLKRLLDSLKNEPPDQQAKNEPNPDGGEQPAGEQPRMRPGDGIPPLAQLKALRAEQAEINDRTKTIAKQNPDANNLPEELRRELEEIQNEQNRLHRLFEEMTAPEKKGVEP